MKKFLLGSAALITLGMASQASAADLGRPYTKAPPMMAAIYDWTGFYIGANGGYGTERDSKFYRGLVGAPIPGLFDTAHDADGGTAGGQIGYRWQSGAFVFGVEAQGNWADFRGSSASTLFANSYRTRMEAFGLFTGQVGYSWNNTLLYVKGGGAIADQRYATFIPAGTLGTASETRGGGTVGVGLEFGFTPNWSAGVEYDHMFLGRRDVTFSGPAVLSTVNNLRLEADIVTARINYRWGGPVVAKY